MDDLVLGLDVGTTATKALLVRLDGAVLASATRGYGLVTGRGPGWVEQDAEALWAAVVDTVRTVAAQCGAGQGIVALAQSSQGGTTIPVDADGQPTYPAISWMDQRAGEQMREVEEAAGADFIRTTTGWALGPGLPLMHIRWLKQYAPAAYAATRRFMFVNDFVGLRLTGRACMDPSNAGITQLMDLETGDWDQRLLALAGAERAQLSPIAPSGAVVGTLGQAAAEATGLPAGTLVINGAHDQYCAAVAASVTAPGHVLLSCGTAWVTLAVPDSRETGLASGLAVSRHVVPGRWGAIASLGAVGASMEWLADQVWGGAGERAALYAAIDAAAGSSAPGAAGALFYPLAGGHASGYGLRRGGFVGLSLAHGRAELARALMEGIACELRAALEEMRAAGLAVGELRMVGGAAKSATWPQIVADVTGTPLALPPVRDAAALGAALLAAAGAGLTAGPEARFPALQSQESRMPPAEGRRQLYDDLFGRRKQLAEGLKRDAQA